MGANDTKVGRVCVWTDESCGTIYVKYLMDSGYELDEAHVCLSEEAFPWTAPGQCSNNSGRLPDGTTYYLFTISVMDAFGDANLFGDGHFYLQAHGSVSDAVTCEHVGSAYAGYFKSVITYAYSCGEEPPDEYGCTYTQGYWKNHPDAWPVNSLTIGGVTYTKAQLMSLLKMAPKGDGSMILAHQLIAAMLNMASGSGGPDDLMNVMSDAQDWMSAYKDGDGKLPYKIMSKTCKTVFEEGVSYASALDLFNNGDFGPLHCGDSGNETSLPQ
jgi:hypothetical protein